MPQQAPLQRAPQQHQLGQLNHQPERQFAVQRSQTIFITGASTGIGRATAELFADRGWNVVATMRSVEKAGALAQRSNVLVTGCDVTDPPSITAALAAAQQRFGRIDVVVNNAGYGLVGAFEATPEQNIRRQFDVNVFGVMAVTRAVLPLFRSQGHGIVINVASMGGRLTIPLYSSYHATKWAVEGFSESLQYELGPLNIRVKIIEPGPIKTDFYDRSMDRVDDGGIAAYADTVNKAMPRMQAAGAAGGSPQRVAQTIFRAATDGSTRLRYQTDRSGKVNLMVRRLLPDRIFFWLTRMYLLR